MNTQRLVMDFRTNETILNYVAGADLGRFSQQGTVTPDHVIRTKSNPLVTPPPEAGRLEEFTAGASRRRRTICCGVSRLFRSQ